MEKAGFLEQIAAWFGARSGETERDRERDRERESCCEERRVLDMWGVPTGVSEMRMISGFSFKKLYLHLIFPTHLYVPTTLS
jgi:hypothetical protein